MMPAPQLGCNLTRHLGWIRGVGIPGLMLLGALACGHNLEVDVHLEAPARPDPFTGVSAIELWADLRGRLVLVGGGRWDQGPLDFAEPLDPTVSRFVVLGLDDAGRLLSSGVSAPLDLIGAPPAGPIAVYFARVGLISELSISAPAVEGLEALSLETGGVLFVGGRDRDGCAQVQSEIYRTTGVSAGPRLLQGRTGAQVHRLPSGQVLLLGGVSIVDCQSAGLAQDSLLLDPVRNTARAISVGALRPGAAVAVVDESLVVAAGGVDAPIYATEVQGIDPRGGEVRRLGLLDGPRAFASAASLGAGRVLLAGGLGTESGPGLDYASVFVTRRGTALSQRIALGISMRGASAVATLAGGVLLAGGRGSDDQGLGTVRMVSVGSETSVPLGDASVVTSLTTTVAEARAVALGDGGVLLLPRDGRAPHWVRLLPLGSQQLSDALAGPLVGGVRDDGQVLLRSPTGRLGTFNPGPAALLGPQAAFGGLVLDPERGQAQGLGLTPLRPGSWSSTTLGLQGQASLLRPGRGPTEWAVIGSQEYEDFELKVSVNLSEGAQAAFLMGFDGVEYDFVSLEGNAAVGRSPGRAASRPVLCAPVASPKILGLGAHPVTLTRRGDTVTLDTDGDNFADLRCDISASNSGRVALGVVRGRVTYSRLQLRSLP